MILLALLLAAQASPDPAVGVRRGPVPAWVEPIVVDVDLPVPSGPVRESAQYLLVDDQARLGPVPMERFYHGAWRLVTQEALEEMSRLEVDFDPSYSSVVLHRLRIWRDGAWGDRLDDAWITTIQQETSLWQQMFDGIRTLMVVMPDVRVGDVVEYAYTVEGMNPVFGGRFADAYEMAWSVPTGRRHVRLQWPDSRPLHFLAHGPVPSPLVQEEGPWTTATWDRLDLPGTPGEYDLPPGIDLWEWLQVGEWGTWEDVVRWALPLYPAAAQDPEVKALADRACLGATSEERALACLRWVQDEVRYFGIEMGAGSHAPNPPALVIRRRYGDCKDKSLLLVSLLESLGWEAWPVLVSSRDQEGVARWQASPTAFDHVITAARAPGGDRLYWMDPTLTQQGGDLSGLWREDFGVGLPILAGSTDLVQIPSVSLPQGDVEATESWWIQERDDVVRLTVESTYMGRQADLHRAWLADISEEDVGRQGAQRYGLAGLDATPVESIRVRDDRSANRMELREAYRVEGAWDQDTGQGGQALVLPAPQVLGALTLPEEPDRRFPYALPQGLRRTDRVSVVLPQGWPREKMSFVEDNPWFHFSVDTAERSGAVRVTWRLEVRADRVEAADLPAYTEAVERVRGVQGYTVRRNVGRPSILRGRGRRTVLGFLAGMALGALVPAILLVAGVVLRRRREGAQDLPEGGLGPEPLADPEPPRT